MDAMFSSIFIVQCTHAHSYDLYCAQGLPQVLHLYNIKYFVRLFFLTEIYLTLLPHWNWYRSSVELYASPNPIELQKEHKTFDHIFCSPML